jgi:enamine deaminase RidA (YjgF/YER057c/UK114 family)
MSPHTFLLPPGWVRPKGYANGVMAQGRMLFTGGVIGWDHAEAPAGPDLVSQFRQVLENTRAILAEGGAAPEHVVRMTWYVIDREDYIAQRSGLGRAYREVFGAHYPAMAVVQVKGLIEPWALIEIETTAVVPT